MTELELGTTQALLELARQLGRVADANFRQAKAAERVAVVSEASHDLNKQLVATSQELEAAIKLQLMPTNGRA